MITSKKGNPITASSTRMQPRSPVMTDANTPSSDAQRQINQPPAPFANPNNAKNLPTGRLPMNTLGIPYTKPTDGPRKESYGSAVMSDADMMAATGYTPNATKSSDPLRSGHPTRNNQRQAGRPGNKSTGTSAKDNARVRQVR
jgi:hypothetical protein